MSFSGRPSCKGRPRDFLVKRGLLRHRYGNAVTCSPFLPSNCSSPALIKSHGDGVLHPSNQRREVPMMRFLITFCVGVFATLAWQSYGDMARERIANSYPQLGWLAPEAAVAQTAPATIVPPTTSPDQQQLKAMSFDLAALRQRVDQIAAGQDRVTRDITAKLQAAEQDILDKISTPPPQPAAAPARKSAPPPLQLAPPR